MRSPLRPLAGLAPVRSRGAVAAAVGAALLTGAALAAPAGALDPAHASSPEGTPTALHWPTSTPRAARLYLAPPSPWGAGHRGIDIPADEGEPVVAPASGVVVVAGWIVDREVVAIDHGGGLRTALEPVEPGVEVGTVVAAGEEIGTVGGGRSHCAPAACVHLGVRVDGAYVDPLDLLAGLGPVVLME
ncbi:murein hydrolase activator EnvC family protein [Demequina pelophila]|uniref:murein hydrolase activator EnvC family protein n=1 Tax=Demequina pelophila TaxID=1638984 RepID=UPI000781D754|nr:M23 family metallopeptidase [Demequina pelophila]